MITILGIAVIIAAGGGNLKPPLNVNQMTGAAGRLAPPDFRSRAAGSRESEPLMLNSLNGNVAPPLK
jgi:hypothetical protein